MNDYNLYQARVIKCYCKLTGLAEKKGVRRYIDSGLAREFAVRYRNNKKLLDERINGRKEI